MKHIIIIGARGFGRECYDLFKNKKHPRWGWKLKGFLDDKADALDGFEGYPPILGPVETYQIQKNDVFFCALGDPVQRKKYTDIILKNGGKFISCAKTFTFENNKETLKDKQKIFLICEENNFIIHPIKSFLII